MCITGTIFLRRNESGEAPAEIRPESVVLNPVMVPENKANFRRDCVVAVVAVAVSSAHRPVTADLEGQ